MFFRDWWRIETMVGYVELELDEAGTPLTDEYEIDETNQLCFILRREMKKLNPRVLRPMLEVYAEFHPEQFPPGISFANREIRDIEPLIPAMIDFLEDQVDAGIIRLFDDEIVMTATEKVAKPTYSAQPIVPEQTHFIGLRIKDKQGKPVQGFRVMLKLPDGSERPGRTNSAGEVYVDGIAVPGNAKILLLDDCTPGPADAPEWPKEQEFSVKVTDESGNAVPNIWVQFLDGDKYQLVCADGSGAAKYKSKSESVGVTFHDVGELASAMTPVWSQPTAAKRETWLQPEDGKLTVVSLRNGALQRLLLALPNAGAATPSAGAATPSAGAATPAAGAAATSDTKGATSAAAAAAGTALADQFEAFDRIVLKPGEEHQLSVRPHVTMARLVGVNFDTDKCFLLPTALPAMRRIKDLYTEHQRDSLMLVGHADSKGGVAQNEALSLERSVAVFAYLTDNVDGWLAWYDDSIPAGKKWGAGEDRQMLRGLVARQIGFSKPDATAYQQWHNALPFAQRAANWALLDEDGKLGPDTRAQLIGDYMNLDGTTLPSTMRVFCHGCGGAFPLPPPTAGCAWERFSSMRDRRVEFIFFDESTGVTPMPADVTSAPGSLDYPTWLAKAEIEDLTTEAGLKEVTFVEMHDALVRTNSAVILPEGEDPAKTQSGTRALTSVGLFSTLLRYNEEHPSHIDASGKEVRKKLLIAGHSDTKGSDQFNQPLSEERAKVTLALLTGGQKGREDFAKLCMARHDGIDLTQIFHWVADSSDFNFQCKPTRWDQTPSPTTVSSFKKEYNRTFDEKFKDMEGAKRFSAENGTQDAALWGAIFDCYEYGLRCELGDMETSTEGTDELKRLRGMLTWVDANHQSMGFGERFPVDELTKKDVRSKSNRRVEIMMFDEGEEPDLAAAVADPEVMETYLPGAYGKVPVKPMVSARPWKAYWEKKIDPATGKELPACADTPRKMIVDAHGLPAGEPMVYTVEQRIDGAFNTKMHPVTSTSQTERGVADFGEWFDPDHASYKGDLAQNAKFPVATYRFEVMGGGRRKVSKDLVYGDYIDVTYIHEGTKVALADTEFVLRTPWASRLGVTDDKGRAVVHELPPGGAIILPKDFYLVDKPKPPESGPAAPLEPTQKITLRLLDRAYQPRKGVPYRLLAEFPVGWEGHTNDDGLVTAEVPQGIGRLKLVCDDVCSELDLDVEALPGPEQIAGLRVRLNNLGFDAGAPSDTEDDQLRQAIASFRSDKGIRAPADGSILDQPTRDAVVAAYGH